MMCRLVAALVGALEQEFEKSRAALVEQKLEKAKNYTEQANRYWNEVTKGTSERGRQAGRQTATTGPSRAHGRPELRRVWLAGWWCDGWVAATYFFDRNEAEAQAVKGLTRQDVFDFFHRYSSNC